MAARSALLKTAAQLEDARLSRRADLELVLAGDDGRIRPRRRGRSLEVRHRNAPDANQVTKDQKRR